MVALCGCGASPTQAPPAIRASTAASAATIEDVDPPVAAESKAPRVSTTDVRPAPAGALAPVVSSPPVAVAMPRVGIDVALTTLGLGPDGAVAPPTDVDEAGWYTGSAEPGQPGPAVLAGHVDSRSGPAAFYRLSEVVPGDIVDVRRQDGSTIAFEVTAVERHPKDAFPTDSVYGPTPSPTLRLITCGGVFDSATGHYRDNVVVYAVLAQ